MVGLLVALWTVFYMLWHSNAGTVPIVNLSPRGHTIDAQLYLQLTHNCFRCLYTAVHLCTLRTPGFLDPKNVLKDVRGPAVAKILRSHHQDSVNASHSEGLRSTLSPESTVMQLIRETAHMDNADERNRRICFSCEVVKVLQIICVVKYSRSSVLWQALR
jgi:hypothetical protein